MIDIAKIATVHFWFQIRPLPMSKAFTVGFFSFFLIMIIGKAVIRTYASKMKKQFTRADKKLYNLIQSLFLTMGSLGMAWTFFAYEGIPILSARFWLLLWFVSSSIWMYVIIRYYVVEYTDFKVQLAEKERLEKYLPKKSSV